MGLFKQKPKKDSIISFSRVEQNTSQEPVQNQSGVEEKLDKILANQVVISGNQQAILDAIGGTQELMMKLSGMEPPEVPEEPMVEDSQAAKPLRRGRPKES